MGRTQSRSGPREKGRGMTQDASTGNVVVPGAEAAGPPAIAGVATARRYASASRGASTREKYNRVRDAWCGAQSLAALPAHPGTLAVYLAGRAEGGHSPVALSVALAAIGWVHRQAGHVPAHRAKGRAVVADVLEESRSWSSAERVLVSRSMRVVTSVQRMQALT